jgi:hypothetical protein
MIKLDSFFTITAGPDSVILKYEKEGDAINPKTGRKRVTKWQSYHPSVKHALKAYLDYQLRFKLTSGLDALTKAVKELHQSIIDFERAVNEANI